MDEERDSPYSILLTALLHEEEQYRRELNTQDARLVGVTLTYLSGLVAGTAWLAARVAEEARQLIQDPDSPVYGLQALSTSATAAALRGMADGLYFYLFVGIPILASALLLIGTRAWVSMEERVELLHLVGEDAETVLRRLGIPADFHTLRFSRGLALDATKNRQRSELAVVVYWAVVVVGLSILLLSLTIPATHGLIRWFYWIAAALGSGASALQVVRQIRRLLRTHATAKK